MRLLTFDDGSGPQAGILLGEEVVPVSALDAPASSVRGLLEALDANGLAELIQMGNGTGMVFTRNVRCHAVRLSVLKIFDYRIGMRVGI